ncbi:MAG: hypothetical protein KDK45_23780 [Leptospiraceae bacterium]|nr:hypothetical protein [Leptospiraceae bacterium]
MKKVIDTLIIKSEGKGEFISTRIHPDENVRITIRRNIDLLRHWKKFFPGCERYPVETYLFVVKNAHTLKQSIKWLWYIRNHKINSIKHLNHSHKPNRRKASNE